MVPHGHTLCPQSSHFQILLFVFVAIEDELLSFVYCWWPCGHISNTTDCRCASNAPHTVRTGPAVVRYRSHDSPGGLPNLCGYIIIVVPVVSGCILLQLVSSAGSIAS